MDSDKIQKYYERYGKMPSQEEYDVFIKDNEMFRANNEEPEIAIQSDNSIQPTNPYYLAPTDSKLNASTSANYNTESQTKTKKSFWEKYKVGICVGVGVLLIFIIGNSCTYTWTKTDVSGQPETFRDEPYYEVSVGSFDLCDIGTNWTDCINALVDNYNENCASKPVEHTLDPCESRKSKIDDMKAKRYTGACKNPDFITYFGNPPYKH